MRGVTMSAPQSAAPTAKSHAFANLAALLALLPSTATTAEPRCAQARSLGGRQTRAHAVRCAPATLLRSHPCPVCAHGRRPTASAPASLLVPQCNDFCTNNGGDWGKAYPGCLAAYDTSGGITLDVMDCNTLRGVGDGSEVRAMAGTSPLRAGVRERACMCGFVRACAAQPYIDRMSSVFSSLHCLPRGARALDRPLLLKQP